MIVVPDTSISALIGFNNSELEELRTTLRKEFSGEMKTQKALISALISFNMENVEITDNNQEKTRSTPTKTIRFEGVENLRPDSSRNEVDKTYCRQVIFNCGFHLMMP